MPDVRATLPRLDRKTALDAMKAVTADGVVTRAEVEQLDQLQRSRWETRWASSALGLFKSQALSSLSNADRAAQDALGFFERMAVKLHLKAPPRAEHAPLGADAVTKADDATRAMLTERSELERFAAKYDPQRVLIVDPEVDAAYRAARTSETPDEEDPLALAKQLLEKKFHDGPGKARLEALAAEEKAVGKTVLSPVPASLLEGEVTLPPEWKKDQVPLAQVEALDEDLAALSAKLESAFGKTAVCEPEAAIMKRTRAVLLADMQRLIRAYEQVLAAGLPELPPATVLSSESWSYGPWADKTHVTETTYSVQSWKESQGLRQAKSALTTDAKSLLRALQDAAGNPEQSTPRLDELSRLGKASASLTELARHIAQWGPTHTYGTSTTTSRYDEKDYIRARRG